MTDHTIDAAAKDLLIINRQETISSYRGQLMTTGEARRIMYDLLKQGKAKKLIDTDKTLMYRIID